MERTANARAMGGEYVHSGILQEKVASATEGPMKTTNSKKRFQRGIIEVAGKLHL